MKKMMFASLALVATVLMTSCNPYEDGPLISIQSKAARIANTWQVASAIESDGTDITESFSDDQWTFNKEGDATVITKEAGVTLTFGGEWDLESDDEIFELTISGEILSIPFSTTDEYTILRLSNTEFWLLDKNDTEIRLEPF
ncbi:MAG: hypothetical protein AAFU60_10485 [Bacteroidota bacterium]